MKPKKRISTAWAKKIAGRSASDDGVALLGALIFMVIMAGLAVVLLSVVLGQIVPAATAQKRTQTGYAATAGLQVGLALLRSADALPDAEGKVYGDPKKLPCAVSGRVDGETDGVVYAVDIQYFETNPTGSDASWQSANRIKCTTSKGVSDQPRFALLVSKATGAAIPGVKSADAGNRAVVATYQFKVSNINVIGGRIYSSGNDYCLRAVTAKAGSLVQFYPEDQCTNDALELWSYDEDYEIKLASTLVGKKPGLCITGPVAAGQATQDAKLESCRPSTDAGRWNQLWSWTGAYSWLGQQQNISAGPSNYCLSPGFSDGSNLTGKTLRVATGCNGTFAPSSKVGAGAAGYGSHQLVNYKEFGRCADVTGEQITSSFMITYPCKQDPTGSGVYLLWNHKWYYDEPPTGQAIQANQQISVYNKGNALSKYCLQTPSSVSSSKFPIFAACSSDVRQKWTRVADTGDYLTSYVMQDIYGRCLLADPSDPFNGYLSKISVTVCTGSTAQKWNAPATYSDSTIGGFKEYAP